MAEDLNSLISMLSSSGLRTRRSPEEQDSVNQGIQDLEDYNKELRDRTMFEKIQNLKMQKANLNSASVQPDLSAVYNAILGFGPNAAVEHLAKSQVDPQQALAQRIAQGQKLFPTDTKDMDKETLAAHKLRLQALIDSTKPDVNLGSLVGGMVSREAKPPTADESKAAGFYRRTQQAEEDFGKLNGSGYDPTNLAAATARKAANAGFEGAISQEDKLQRQAERNFVNAILRRESGAVISPSEFANAEAQYFPRLGDSPEVLAQKEANRLQSAAELKATGTKALKNIPLISPNSSTPQQKPKTVQQNGHTYTLNPKTGEYE